MKTTINNLDTHLTICTYSMFTGESVYENERDYIVEQGGDEDWEPEFNHAEIVKSLAIESIGAIENALHGTHIVKSIKYIRSWSPQFYNYTTDGYEMEIDFNTGALVAWLRRNDLLSEVEKLKDELQYETYTKWEPYLVVLLDNIIDPNSYNQDMWEAEMGIYCNNITNYPEL